MEPKIPSVRFGKNEPDGLPDVAGGPDDDALLEKTPDDVVELLGFDPLKEENSV